MKSSTNFLFSLCVLFLTSCATLTQEGVQVKSLRVEEELLNNGKADLVLSNEGCKFVNTLNLGEFTLPFGSRLVKLKNESANKLKGNTLLVPNKTFLGIELSPKSGRVYQCPESMNKTLEQIFNSKSI